eukprot:UN22722
MVVVEAEGNTFEVISYSPESEGKKWVSVTRTVPLPTVYQCCWNMFEDDRGVCVEEEPAPPICDAADDCNGHGTTTDIDSTDGCDCVCTGGWTGDDCEIKPITCADQTKKLNYNIYSHISSMENYGWVVGSGMKRFHEGTSVSRIGICTEDETQFEFYDIRKLDTNTEDTKKGYIRVELKGNGSGVVNVSNCKNVALSNYKCLEVKKFA